MVDQYFAQLIRLFNAARGSLWIVNLQFNRKGLQGRPRSIQGVHS